MWIVLWFLLETSWTQNKKFVFVPSILYVCGKQQVKIRPEWEPLDSCLPKRREVEGDVEGDLGVQEKRVHCKEEVYDTVKET